MERANIQLQLADYDAQHLGEYFFYKIIISVLSVFHKILFQKDLLRSVSRIFGCLSFTIPFR